MIELLILTAIIFALMGYHFLYEKEERKEREKLTNALISKSVKEFKELEEPVVGKTPEEPQVAEELIPPSQLSDKDFDKFIKEEIK